MASGARRQRRRRHGRTLSWAITPYDRLDGPVLDATIGPNPVAVPVATSRLVDLASGPVLLAGVALAVASLVLRWRRADPDRRRALAWVLYGVGVSVVWTGLAILLDATALSAVSMAALPVCFLVAVTRHRLWDLQIVVRRSLVYGGLTAIVAAAYAGIVGLLGGAVGASTGAPIVATAVVAMLVLPLHHVLRRTVNRVIHGQAEDPLVTTTALGRRLGSAVTPDQLTTVVLPEILDGVVRALRLRHLSLVMTDGATFSSGVAGADPLELPLRHAGRPVGTLRVVPARGGLTRAERRAVDDVAAHAAVAAHGVLLMGELQRERERVVVAREEERRRLRRELHDGVGTALAAARLQAESARDLMTEHPREGLALLDRLTVALRDAVHDVRAVTRKLRPATLDELGLAGALRELGARSASAGRAVEVDVGELGEVPAAVEVAAYLVAAELVTNACRHSGASRIAVSVRRDGELRVRVTDDGCGIGPGAEPGVGLASVRRRVDEVGGRMVHHDGPGTTLEVRLPLESR
ncbi:histidine kinase/DNA gyrase B/HSP90-like ATPase [Pseudonocardia sediminis]|uniref:histidine kinase n=1 Tax=Pseudonocardia sediminis TaxID=1397368 RepID=A0A4Q7UX40_PSEST|nr:ATP-binding protein [Pseudonocardia sediminis]RZT85491.1 histidine kinase/DNA gyrase B/HSP90-like ATPase [Pseudonocardia sediminis]